MIAECMLFLALSTTPTIGQETEFINQHIECRQVIPLAMHDYAHLYLEHFEFENIDTAVRIGWCESRGKSNAFRSDNKDSGLMQFVPWTWNWIAESYDLPEWGSWVLTYRDYPWEGHPRETQNDLSNYEIIKVQFSPYYNILFASILAEDIYGRTQWRDWSSSQWCWEDDIIWNAIREREGA